MPVELANLIEKYNDHYSDAVKDYNRNSKKDFDQYKKKFRIDVIVEELEPLIVKIVWTDNNGNVRNWLEQNRDQLQQQLETN